MIDRSKTRVLAIDPGKTCGWSTSHYGYGAKPEGEFLSWLFRILGTDLFDRVVIERFHTRTLTKDGEETLKVIGAIKFICDIRRIEHQMVNPDAKKKTIKEVSNEIRNRHSVDAEAIRLWDLRYGHWNK